MPKPRVLPVPVLAWPMMSWPPSATGRVIAWIGNGLVILCSASASTMSWWIGKSENEATGSGSVTTWATVSAKMASALASSGSVVASVTSVMGLFRSAGAHAPAQGLWADRRSSGGG